MRLRRSGQLVFVLEPELVLHSLSALRQRFGEP
jgi:hypothetical protein